MLIVGLGNPGRKYVGTRHNVGFDLVDRLVSRWRGSSWWTTDAGAVVSEATVQGREVLLLKPLTYMNRSGRPVSRFVREREIPVGECLVVVDDMHLETGKIRFRRKGSAGGHNGLSSITECLGTAEYPRLRIGVGPAPPSSEWADFVLTPWEGDDRDAVDAAILRAAEGVEMLLELGIERTMGRFNG
jgi:PTH1 family peptidyl-tRNA hydrolase